jgi:hypothetical protein
VAGAGTGGTAVSRVFRSACFVVAVVAGLAGAVMVVAPADTGSYFSWPIGPPPVAALAAALRSFDDLHPTRRVPYLLLVTALAAVAGVALATLPRDRTAPSPSPR